MEKLLLVDGSNLLFQMFYGMPSRILNSRGFPIQGTLGFVGALLKMLRMVQPTHAAVFFDGETENPRLSLDENYKANREDYSQMPLEDTPFSQLPDIFKCLECLGIPYAETTCCEADDWLAAAAQKYGDREVVIASFDSDLFQLITEKVHILRYRGKGSTLWDEAMLREKLGISPGQYAAYKALTGDHSDNIPGVPGIGPKTAAALMDQFGSLDALLAAAEQIKKPSVRASVLAHLDRIRKNHALIRLDGEAELPFPLEKMAWTDPGCTTMQVLTQCRIR